MDSLNQEKDLLPCSASGLFLSPKQPKASPLPPFPFSKWEKANKASSTKSQIIVHMVSACSHANVHFNGNKSFQAKKQISNSEIADAANKRGKTLKTVGRQGGLRKTY